MHRYGIGVAVINPLFIRQSGGGCKVRTKQTRRKSPNTLLTTGWICGSIPPMEAIREQLKLCSQQYNLCLNTVVALQNNLISLAGRVFSEVNQLLYPFYSLKNFLGPDFCLQDSCVFSYFMFLVLSRLFYFCRRFNSITQFFPNANPVFS